MMVCEKRRRMSDIDTEQETTSAASSDVAMASDASQLKQHPSINVRAA